MCVCVCVCMCVCLCVYVWFGLLGFNVADVISVAIILPRPWVKL